jgi:methyl-accepting chemotaxis protein
MNCSISRAFLVFRNVILAGTVAALLASVIALQRLKIGGLPYERIVASKDLVADILPPPEYVIEAYLEAQLAAREPNKWQLHAERLQKLKESYVERHDFWVRSTLLPESLRDGLTVTAHAPAMAFWTGIESDFLPALKAGDQAKAAAALTKIGADYDAHRRHIDEVVLKSDQFSKEVESAADRDSVLFQTLMFGAGGAVFIITSVGIGLLRCKACEPLLELSDYMAELAAGRYGKSVPFGERSDEIGRMAKSVDVFRMALVEREAGRAREVEAEERRREEVKRAEIEAVRQERELVSSSIGAGLEQLSSKNLAYRVSDALPEAYRKLQSDFNAAVRQLDEAIAGVALAVEGIGAGTDQITSASDDLAMRTERQAANLEEMTAAIKEISGALQLMAAEASAASGVAGTTKAEAEKSDSIMRQAVDAMGRIEDSSKGIEQIIGVVDEIAFQTNLLALNAGVEAARAGEAGRGFAVVASEVRALAQRSAEAAKEIKALIAASSSEVGQGSDLVKATSEALKRISAQVSETDGIITRIANAAKQQASSLAEIDAAASEIDRNTQHNAAIVEETTAATHGLQHETAELVSAISTFRLTPREARRVVETPRISVNAAA